MSTWDRPLPASAYVMLDGHAGLVKLYGMVTAHTAKTCTFVPDRDCYRFRNGIARRVPKKHVCFQYVHVEQGDHHV